MNLYDEICKLAYELYERSGRCDGRDVENWVEAERIVMASFAVVPQPVKEAAPKKKAPAKAAAKKPAAAKTAAKTAKGTAAPKAKKAAKTGE